MLSSPALACEADDTHRYRARTTLHIRCSQALARLAIYLCLDLDLNLYSAWLRKKLYDYDHNAIRNCAAALDASEKM